MSTFLQPVRLLTRSKQVTQGFVQDGNQLTFIAWLQFLYLFDFVVSKWFNDLAMTFMQTRKVYD